MEQENKAPEETQNPEGQTAENTATKEPEREELKKRIPFFDETASVLEKGGEIDLLINALYEACEAKNIPFIGAITYAVSDEGNSFSVGLRGIQNAGEGGFAPVNLHAMAAVMNSKDLSEFVLNIANDKRSMQMIDMLSQLD